MKDRRNNYDIQAEQAKKHFLTYDQQELIQRCCLAFDEDYFYICFLSQPYRIHRKTGHMERKRGEQWEDGNSFHEVMTILDWLCDSKENRCITGRWVNMITQGHSFHGSLQEDVGGPYAGMFDRDPQGFSEACRALEGKKHPSADLAYTIELVDGLRVLVQLWHGDEEFSPRLRCLWDENTTRYIRYETSWYAVELLLQRISEKMEEN